MSLNVNKKISIITICKNEKYTIDKTIKSVLDQSYSNIEYIIVDGGSNDGTDKIIESYNDEVDIVISEPDKGIYDAMNKGGTRAIGDYLLFLNGGDYLANKYVLDKVSTYGFDKDIIYGYMQSPAGKLIKQLKDVKLSKYLEQYTLPHQATFIRRGIFEKLGGYNDKFIIAGDYEFFVRGILKYSATNKYIPELITIFNSHGIAKRKPNITAKEKKVVQRKAKRLKWVRKFKVSNLI